MNEDRANTGTENCTRWVMTESSRTRFARLHYPRSCAVFRLNTMKFNRKSLFCTASKMMPREGTRPTTSCRPGPPPRRRGLMSSCMTTLASLLLTCGLVVTAGCKKSDSKSRLQIVALAPLTGPDASFGEYVRNGIELAKDHAASRYPGKI